MKYQNCISLGWFCGTACSLERLGLRSTSSPFDWCFSDYWAVLYMIQNRFHDFMSPENLHIVDDNPRIFIDNKYHFYFNHDVKEDFESEIDQIYSKYSRRINRFIEMIKHPTIFFRCVRNESEIEYINSNWKYAEGVVKSYNEQNEIIYIVLSKMGHLPKEVFSYRLGVNRYIGELLEMRYLFNQSQELIKFCNTILEDEIVNQNKKNDSKKKYREAVQIVNRCFESTNYCNLLHNFFVSKKCDKTGLYIWGAGKYGRLFVEWFKQNHYNILAIIDSKKVGNIERVSIIKPEEIEKETPILIAVSSEENVFLIFEQIKELKIDNELMTIDEIVSDLNINKIDSLLKYEYKENNDN